MRSFASICGKSPTFRAVLTHFSHPAPPSRSFFAPPGPKSAIFGILIPRRGPRCPKTGFSWRFGAARTVFQPPATSPGESGPLHAIAPPIQFSHPLSILNFTARRPTCKTSPKPSCFRLDNKGTTAFVPHEQKHYFIGLTPLCRPALHGWRAVFGPIPPGMQPRPTTPISPPFRHHSRLMPPKTTDRSESVPYHSQNP